MGLCSYKWDQQCGSSSISFQSIDAATNSFSEENRVGEGGFGVVYKVLKQIHL